MSFTPTVRKRLAAFTPLVPLDGASRPIAIGPGRHIALCVNDTTQVYVGLNGALPETISPDVGWLCYGKGAAEQADYSKPLTVVVGSPGHREPLARIPNLAPAQQTIGATIWTPSRADLERLMPVALAADDPDRSRLALTTIRLEPTDGALTAVACNGFRIHIQRGLPTKGLTEPTLFPATLVSGLLRSDVVTMAVRRIDATRLRLDGYDPAGQLVVVATWSDSPRYPDWRRTVPAPPLLDGGLAAADGLLHQAEHTTNRLGEGADTIPVWQSAFGDHGERRVTLDPRYLADAVRHLGNSHVTIAASAVAYGPVTIVYGDWQAVIMPMYVKGEKNG